MARSSSAFFPQPKISLNQSQQRMLREFSNEGLTAEGFSGRDWFNSFCHEHALSFLVKQKKCSLNEVFSILDNLDENQAEGIFLGLNREEVVGLTKYQIDAFLKYGLSKDELIGLGQFQIQALLALKEDGIKYGDLRNQNWISSYDHAVALLYLIRMKEKSFVDACNDLKDLNSNEARAISYGIEKEEIQGLDKEAISLLISRRELDGLQKREQLEGLNAYQVGIIKRLFHFGLTHLMVRHQIRIKQWDSNVENSFNRLVFERGIPIKQVISMISGLTNHQIYGLSQGLTLDEMKDLNQYQISALERCRNH